MENLFEIIMTKLERIERMITIIRENQEIKETQDLLCPGLTSRRV